AFIDWILELSTAIGIPPSLRSIGISTSVVGKLVNIAIEDICHPLNPRPVTEDDFYAIYQDALVFRGAA
ncbi:MAG: iron-containing alcohol dehydrogenase, partial [Cyanobacteria bacterium P01_F01_bin.116]